MAGVLYCILLFGKHQLHVSGKLALINHYCQRPLIQSEETMGSNLLEILNDPEGAPRTLREQLQNAGRITDRIDHDTHIPAEYLSETPPAPPAVKIELTGRCNYACTFCALTTRAKQPRRDTDMPIDLFRKIVNDMANEGVKRFGMFLIGESFLNMDLLVAAIAHVKSIDRFSFVTTNGSLATPENVEKVMEAGLNSLKFSLTTADDKQFEAVIQRPAKNRHRAVENIKLARQVRDKGGYSCEISASWIDFNDAQREAMDAAVAEVRDHVDTIYGLPLYSFGSLAEDGQRGSGMKEPVPGNIGRIANPVPPLPCWLPFHKTHVLHDGRLTLCAFDAGRDDHNWVCGDLRKQSFMEAWHSETARTLRRAHLKKDVRGTKCEKCAAYGG